MSIPLVTKGMIAIASSSQRTIQRFILPLKLKIKQEPIKLNIEEITNIKLNIKKIFG